jgi:ABC-type bacteriocin/lantibiotic exporter with double-glycine peptidase domain
MYSWFKHLKNGLSRKLPEDHFNKAIKYGSLRNNLKYIYPSIITHWRSGVVSMSLLILSSALTYPQPMITRYLIDNVLLKKKIDLLMPVIGLMVFIGISLFLTNLLKQYYNIRFSQEVILDLQEKLIAKVMTLPKLFFDKNRSGYLMSRISNDVQGVNWFISGTVVNLFIEALRFIGGVYFLFYLEWRIALPVMLTLPLPFLSTRFFARRSYAMSHYNSELSARANASLQETVSSIPLIKSFATEQRAISGLVKQLKKRLTMSYEQNSVSSLNNAITRFMPSIARFAVLVFGSYWVINGEWQLGSLLAFQAYLSFVYTPVTQLSSSITQLQSARATLDRLATLFAMDSEANTSSGIDVAKLKGQIEFKNIAFAYETKKPVLTDLSFKIKPGEHWAIVGSSGIGKTTLTSLILKLYIPQQGEIYFDDIAASEFNIRALRRRIGYVSQVTCLQTGTIMENLKYGNLDASDEAVIKATKIADIHNFIESMPDKYLTVVEENGDNFSAGQKQRIAIARALIRNPDILILDEPTSALDNVTEKSIYDALPESVKNKTTITVAHRMRTIKLSDKIILLRHNQNPLIGSHDELMQHQDYQEFFANI